MQILLRMLQMIVLIWMIGTIHIAVQYAHLLHQVNVQFWIWPVIVITVLTALVSVTVINRYIHNIRIFKNENNKLKHFHPGDGVNRTEKIMKIFIVVSLYNGMLEESDYFATTSGILASQQFSDWAIKAGFRKPDLYESFENYYDNFQTEVKKTEIRIFKTELSAPNVPIT